jgi:hypothetical protein
MHPFSRIKAFLLKRVWSPFAVLAIVQGTWAAFSPVPITVAIWTWFSGWNLTMLNQINWPWLALMFIGIVMLALRTSWLGHLIKEPTGSGQDTRAVANTSPGAAVALSEAEANDALDHVEIEVFPNFALPVIGGVAVYQNLDGNPMGYLLRIRNGRPYPAEITNYRVTIKAVDDRFQEIVTWHAPNWKASNGFDAYLPVYDVRRPAEGLVRPPENVMRIILAGDHITQVPIPVDIHNIEKARLVNLRWFAFVELSVRCGDVERILPRVDHSSGYYKLDSSGPSQDLEHLASIEKTQRADAPVQPLTLPPSLVIMRVERPRPSRYWIQMYANHMFQLNATVEVGIENHGPATAVRSPVMEWRAAGSDGTTGLVCSLPPSRIDEKEPTKEPPNEFVLRLPANSGVEWHRLQFGTVMGFGGGGEFQGEMDNQPPADTDFVLRFQVDGAAEISETIACFRGKQWHVRPDDTSREFEANDTAPETPLGVVRWSSRANPQ